MTTSRHEVIKVKHGRHIDHLVDGHLYHWRQGRREEHSIDTCAINPTTCTMGHNCAGHDDDHQHGPDCGHPLIPHGDHFDYLVEDHLHCVHEGHCDHHGLIKVVSI